ncbi:zinc ribbon domain-containing protein [Alteromonas mediterranea]|uniref:zinc ribbon domain-containing protein n=1 Tax=Alteromonas mediterranea TaxID=314275 RepID=UPI001131EE0A|nr:zinc ribbon domain-containing protein [Alteromonas mediterranea]QDG36556.1 zinc ribbon domain-containing protein [Alteromonas mediterranea]
MSLVKCKECGNKVSTKASACPNCGANPPKKTSLFTKIVAVLIVVTAFMMFNIESNLTPEERQQRQELAKQREAERKAEEAAEAQREAKEQAEEKRKGFHCLSSWDGSHRGVVKYVESILRDPDSFEHVETRITPVNDNVHYLTMTYRAKNGFGGVNVESVSAEVEHETCKATIQASSN